MKQAKKRRGGRPSKKDTLDLPQLERLVSLGLTDGQLGFIFSVDESTINRWKKDRRVSQVLKKGKEVADQMVERSLFERACGYSHPEDKIFQYEGEPVVVPTIKHYPPDTLAAIFWLKNRKPKDWRDRQEIEHRMPEHLLEKFKGLTVDNLAAKAKELLRKLS